MCKAVGGVMMMFGHAPITCTVVGVSFVVVLWVFGLEDDGWSCLHQVGKH